MKSTNLRIVAATIALLVSGYCGAREAVANPTKLPLKCEEGSPIPNRLIFGTFSVKTSATFGNGDDKNAMPPVGGVVIISPSKTAGHACVKIFQSSGHPNPFIIMLKTNGKDEAGETFTLGLESFAFYVRALPLYEPDCSTSQPPVCGVSKNHVIYGSNIFDYTTPSADSAGTWGGSGK